MRPYKSSGKKATPIKLSKERTFSQEFTAYGEGGRVVCSDKVHQTMVVIAAIMRPCFLRAVQKSATFFLL